MRVLVWGLIFTGTEQYHFFWISEKNLEAASNKFFAYADGGVNFVWLTDNEKTAYVTDDHFDTGFYTDLGLGYKIGVGRTNHLLLSIGYSLKKLKETYQTYSYLPPDNALQKQDVDYSLNRLTLKIGWEF